MTSQGTSQRTRVGILFGGQSSEHPISVITASGVLGVLDTQKYEPVLIGITREGRWRLSSVEELERTREAATEADFTGTGPEVFLPMGERGASLVLRDAQGGLSEGPVLDVVFSLLHGAYGEDGTLQGALELAGLPYVGSGVTASAVGMDKHFMKVAFEAAGLAVGPYTVITDRDWALDPEGARERVHELGLPVFVKPARAGSSFGITRVSDWAELDAAIEEARRFDPKLVVEAGIVGREIECAVLDGRDHAKPRASYPGEIVSVGEEHAFYDFEAKYVQTTDSQLACPADLPEDVRERIRDVAVRAFLAVDGEGLCRTDVFYTEAGEVVVNEVNTMPGFTPISMYPQMWAATGLAYEDLVDELLQLALSRRIGLR